MPDLKRKGSYTRPSNGMPWPLSKVQCALAAALRSMTLAEYLKGGRVSERWAWRQQASIVLT